jgi:4-amino-4-deoxy-L-arabinose transferase-like glycosyltransferase
MRAGAGLEVEQLRMVGRTARTRIRWTAWLLAVTAAAAALTVAVWWTGGFSVRIAGVQVRSRSWVRPAIVALAGAVLIIGLERVRVAGWLARAWNAAESQRVAGPMAALAMAWTLAAGIVFGTYAAGGADSYGYIGQAGLLVHGRLTDTVPLRPSFTWPDVEMTLTPLGFNRGRSPGVIAPRYPPGFPLLLAPLTLLPETAIYMLVPVLGVLAVWATYRLGVRLGDPLAGALAAAVLSLSPTFLFQVVQPMSDVPAAACWLWALLAAANGSRGGAAAAGALASIAIMIRPNLAPLAALVFVPVAFGGTQARAQRAMLFAAALVPGLIALGWIQNVRYGSPLASGYGTLEDGFAFAYLAPNLARYPRWLTETHTWFIWLSLLAPFWIARRACPERSRRACPERLLAWTAVALALAVWAAYLPYVYFQPDEWFYTRFLLPAMPIMLLFAVAVSLWMLRELPTSLRAAVTTGLLLALLATQLQVARTRGVFEIRLQEWKYPLAGAFVREKLPSTAFILAGQHSGSVRYYANRPTLRWDVLAPGQLDRVVAALRAEGFEPFVVVDGGEDEAFRRRFGDAGQQAVRGMTPLAALGDAHVYGFGR